MHLAPKQIPGRALDIQVGVCLCFAARIVANIATHCLISASELIDGTPMPQAGGLLSFIVALKVLGAASGNLGSVLSV